MKQPVLWLALLCHLLLAFGYLISTPVFEAPDENTHFQYVLHLAGARSLPLVPGTAEALGRSRLDEVIQAYHPPLYYALLAVTLGAAGFRDIAATGAMNPDYGATDPARPGRYLHFVHGADERPPVSAEVRVFRLLRGWSVLFGLLVVFLTHRLGRLAFPASPAVADAAALLLACLPQWSFMHAVVNNDNLATLLCHVALLLLAAALARRRLSIMTGLGLGLIIGLALLAKLTAVFLVPLAVLVHAFAFCAWREERRTVLLSGAAAALSAAAVSGWFFLRNGRLYGSLMALDVHQASFGGSLRISAGEVWDYLTGGFLPTLFRSLLGDLGWFCFPSADWVILAGKIAALLAALGLIRRVASRRKEGDRTVIALLSGCALLVFGLVVHYNTLMRGPHARYLFPAAGALSVLFACGLVSAAGLIPARARRALLPLFILAPPAIGGVVLLAQFRPAFSPEQTAAPAYHACLARGIATEPHEAAIELLEPADGALLQAAPLFRWRAPVEDGAVYTLHFYTAAGRVLLATHEHMHVEIRGDSWRFPEEWWRYFGPRGEPVFWKVRRLPDRARGEAAGATPESRAWRFTAK
ncbi:MAG: DUF2142 domain-containing protein [Planctomycetes bacterium]|nr:DUF2142 domain-containing protein [Planctomycetota bacterium]